MAEAIESYMEDSDVADDPDHDPHFDPEKEQPDTDSSSGEDELVEDQISSSVLQVDVGKLSGSTYRGRSAVGSIRELREKCGFNKTIQ